MDPNTLKVFAEALLEFFKPKLAPWAYALIKSVIDGWVTSFVPTMGAAPDALKDWVKSFLIAEATKIPIPFVALVVTRVLDKLDGQVLDYLWDLVQSKLTGGPVAMHAVACPDVTFDDLV